MKISFYILFAFLFMVIAAAPSPSVDMILFNGNIITVDGYLSKVQAIAITKNKILAVGTDAEIKKMAGTSTRMIDLHGKTVIPGLTDAHTHPETASVSELSEPIPDVHTISDVLGWIVKESHQKKEGEWIVYPKLFFTRLHELRQPTLAELDSVAPRNPVFLNGSYGGMINSAAMNVSMITPQSTDPGIFHDPKTGALSGLIRSSAFSLLKMPPAKHLSLQETKDALVIMLKRYNEFGITGICSGMGNDESYSMYKDLSEKKLLPVRVCQNILLNVKPGGTLQMLVDSIKALRHRTGEGDEMVRIGALKIVLDGGILTGTAYMREPWGKKASEVFGFTDTTYKGVLNYSKEELFAVVKTANDLDWKFTAHCTGGGGVDLLLDVFEEVNRIKPIKKNRFSIIHGNFFTKASIRRMHELGIYADMQPAWFYKDADAMQYILGNKTIETFHPYHSLIEGGVMVNGGSDHMVKLDANESINPYNPFLAMWSMITRTTEKGSVIVPAEAISRMEALKMYTINNAFASFEEKIKGSIEPGKLADIAVLTDDLLTCPLDQIKNIRSDLTVMGGKIVYSSGRVLSENTGKN